MKNFATHVCSFEAARRVGVKTKYDDVRRDVLAAGRYSIFEATANQYSIGMFTAIDNDPDLIIDRTMGYPWIGVKSRNAERSVPA